ncbi:MAG: flagellar assembly protein FliH [Candidatus Petromonas sp.]|nr:flagellar assembly protein FliH [Candidatus Petromonas sp.]
MSRILKSSQVVIDKDKFILSSRILTDKKNKKIDDGNNKKEFHETKAKELEVEKKVQKKIKEAKEEAEKIIGEAYEKSKNIMQQAQRDGYEKGKELGFEEGKKQAESLITEALNIKEAVLKSKKQLLKDIEEDVISLVIDTVEKILNKKVEEDYETIYNLIQLGLEKCAFTENLILRVSPEDYDFVISIKDKILALSENISDIQIKQDKSLRKGSCIIDTSSGSIDSSIWTQFNHVKEIFEELLRGE